MLLWLQATLEDVAKEASRCPCFCPKLEPLIILSYIQEVIYLPKKERAILPITTVQEVRAEHRASGLNQSIQTRRGSQSHSAAVIAGDKTGKSLGEHAGQLGQCKGNPERSPQTCLG